MKILLITLSVIVAALVHWGLSFWDIGGISPPFIPAVAFFWFWRLRLQGRLWLAILLGFFLDSFRVFPFGTYLLVFFMEALLAEVLRTFFSNPRAPLTQGVVLGIMLALFFGLVPVVAGLFGGFTALPVNGVSLLPLALGSLLWTAIFASLLALVLRILNPTVR